MNLDPFLAKLAIGFLAGGMWISATTLLAERLGTRVGGLVAGLPSTVVLSMFFIGWAQGSQQAFDATTAFPAAFGAVGPFLLFSAAVITRGIGLALFAGFSVWMTLELLIILWPPKTYGLASAIWLGLFLLTSWIMWDRMNIQPRPGQKQVYSSLQLVVRACFSGAIIVLSVMASKYGGAVWGSVFAGFPAVFTASLIITYHSLGPEFSKSMTLPMLVSAMTNCMVFVTTLRYSVLTLGIFFACLTGYLASFVSAFMIWRFILKRWQ